MPIKLLAKRKQLDFLNDVADKLSKVSKEIRTVQNDKDLSPAEKRDRLNILTQQRNDISRQGQAEYKEKFSEGVG